MQMPIYNPLMFANPVVPDLYYQTKSPQQLIAQLYCGLNSLAEYTNKLGNYYVPQFKGEWNATEMYDPNDLVIDSAGNTWVALKPVPKGTPLEESEYWHIAYPYSEQFNSLKELVSEQFNSLQELVNTFDNRINENKSNINILFNEINPLMYGAKGDGETDDTEALQQMFNECDNKTVNLLGLTYMISSQINLPGLSKTIIKNGKIKAHCNFSDPYLIKTSSTPSETSEYKTFGSENVIFEDITFNGNYRTSCLYIDFSLNFLIINSNFIKFSIYGINSASNSSHEIRISSCYFRNNYPNQQSLANTTAINFESPDSYVSDTVIYATNGIVSNAKYNTFVNVHAVCSKSFVINSSFQIIDSCYIDSGTIDINYPFNVFISNALILYATAKPAFNINFNGIISGLYIDASYNAQTGKSDIFNITGSISDANNVEVNINAYNGNNNCGKLFCFRNNHNAAYISPQTQLYSITENGKINAIGAENASAYDGGLSINSENIWVGFELTNIEKNTDYAISTEANTTGLIKIIGFNSLDISTEGTILLTTTQNQKIVFNSNQYEHILVAAFNPVTYKFKLTHA